MDGDKRERPIQRHLQPRRLRVGIDVRINPIAVTAAASNPVAKKRASTVCFAWPTTNCSGLIALKCPRAAAAT